MKALVISAILPLLVLWGRAQTVQPDRFPEFSTEATIQEVATAPDGSTFVRGDFSAIDGVPRPGLAKLRADGTLDPAFAPPEDAETIFVDRFGSPVYAFYFAFAGTSSTLFPLKNGNLVWSDFFGHWMRGPDGQLIPDSFDGFDLGFEEDPEPQFERDGELCLVIHRTGGLNEIAFANPADGSQLRTLSLPDDFAFYPNFSVKPAPDGKLWVLNSSNPVFTGNGGRFSHTAHIRNQLLRLLPNGEFDPDFAGVNLTPNVYYTFEQSTASQVTLSYQPPRTLLYFGGSQAATTIERRDPDGNLISTESLSPARAGLSSQVNFNYAVSAETAYAIRSHPLEIYRSAEPQPVTFFEGESLDFPAGLLQLNSLPDGSLLVGGTRKITPQGELDPSHHIAQATTAPVFSRLLPLDDDRVLLAGDFDQAAGLQRGGAVVLNADQSLDPSFQPDIDLRRVSDIAVKANGHFLVVVQRNTTDSEGDTSRLLELDERGRLLDVIPLNFANNINEIDGNRPPLNEADSVSIQLLPGGDVLLNVANNSSPVPIQSSWILPGGRVVNAARIVTSNSAFSVSADSQDLSEVRFLGDDLIHAGGVIYQLREHIAYNPRPLPTGRSFTGLFPDGSLLLNDRRWDPGEGFRDEVLSFLPRLEFYLPEFIPARNGKYFLTSRTISQPTSNGFLTGFSVPRPLAVLRLHSSLQVDPTFRITLDDEGLMGDILPVGDDLWITGQFSEVNGVTRQGLAIISDGQAGGFQDWMRAVTDVSPDAPVTFDPAADSDRDGLSDLYEYALGSHPVIPSIVDPRLVEISPNTYRLPCNPDAPEVIRQLQVSTDLENWRPALASEAQLETTESCLTWTLRPGFQRLYCRVKITGPQ